MITIIQTALFYFCTQCTKICLVILNIDLKCVNTSKITRPATANKINIIVPKRAADDLCFHVSEVKFWNSLPTLRQF